MTILHRLALLSVQVESLDSLLNEIVEGAIAVAGSDFGDIQLLDPESGHLKIAAQWGFPDWWVQCWNEVPKGQGACGTALERGERVIIEDVGQSPLYSDDAARNSLLTVGVRSVISTPLVGRSGTLVGRLSTHYQWLHQADEDALRLLDLLARQATDLIERTQVEARQRESNEQIKFITEGAGVDVGDGSDGGTVTFKGRNLAITWNGNEWSPL